mmetsp:Transcript_30053/g.70048  ORF Transcript_30053/g.70048 Transcript_30053/m.70048 type:complete len:261 (+) Transcript_30053:24-806(+)
MACRLSTSRASALGGDMEAQLPLREDWKRSLTVLLPAEDQGTSCGSSSCPVRADLSFTHLHSTLQWSSLRKRRQTHCGMRQGSSELVVRTMSGTMWSQLSISSGVGRPRRKCLLGGEATNQLRAKGFVSCCSNHNGEVCQSRMQGGAEQLRPSHRSRSSACVWTRTCSQRWQQQLLPRDQIGLPRCACSRIRCKATSPSVRCLAAPSSAATWRGKRRWHLWNRCWHGIRNCLRQHRQHCIWLPRTCTRKVKVQLATTPVR